jgi:hypothetical protein
VARTVGKQSIRWRRAVDTFLHPLLMGARKSLTDKPPVQCKFIHKECKCR